MRLKSIIINILIPILAYNGLLLINSGFLRKDYIQSVEQIPTVAYEKLKHGEDLTAVTRWAVEKRNQLKHDTREKGSYLDKRWAEERNMQKYNNSLGPSYAWLFSKIQTKSGESAEDVNLQIIKGSGRTNADINESIEEKAWMGAGFVVVVCFLVITRISSSTTHPKRNIVIPELGRITGGLVGGAIGVHLGVALSEELAIPNQLANFGMVGWLTCCVLVAFLFVYVLEKLLYHAPKTIRKKSSVIHHQESAMAETE